MYLQQGSFGGRGGGARPQVAGASWVEQVRNANASSAYSTPASSSAAAPAPSAVQAAAAIAAAQAIAARLAAQAPQQ
jgi:hypothetical protein